MNELTSQKISPLPIKSQQGMTMIEVLITILISAIGLLGIAALQTMSLKGNIDSAQRTAAAAISNDIIDRLRANPAGRNANNYATSFTTYSACSVGTAPPANICADYYNQATGAAVNSSACTSAQLALFDAWELSCGYINQNNNISSPVNALVSPVISVTCTDSDATDTLACSNNSNHAVVVTWSGTAKDANQGGGTETHSVTVNIGI